MKKTFLLLFTLGISLVCSATFLQINSSANDILITDNYTVKSILSNYKNVEDFEKVFSPSDATDSQYLLKMPAGEGGWLLQKENDHNVAGIIYRGGNEIKFNPSTDPNAATIKVIKSALNARQNK